MTGAASGLSGRDRRAATLERAEAAHAKGRAAEAAALYRELAVVLRAACVGGEIGFAERLAGVLALQMQRLREGAEPMRQAEKIRAIRRKAMPPRQLRCGRRISAT